MTPRQRILAAAIHCMENHAHFPGADRLSEIVHVTKYQAAMATKEIIARGWVLMTPRCIVTEVRLCAEDAAVLLA